MNTVILSNNRLTEQAWPQTAFAYMLQNMQLSKFFGTGTDSLITVNKDLSVKPGNKVTCKLRLPLTEAGGYDDSDIEGAEEALAFYNFPVEIHERSHGVRSNGKMTEQYTKIDIIREATEALMDWAAEAVENDLVYALCGLGNQGTYVGEGTSSIETVTELAPSTSRVIIAGQSVGGVYTDETTIAVLGDASATDYRNYLFGTKVIDRAKAKAQMAQPKFRPVKVNGKGYYIMFLHTYQVADLRQDPLWNETQQQTNLRGLMNPIFTRGKDGPSVPESTRMFDGAIGVWNDVILFELERMPLRLAGEVFASATDEVHANITAANKCCVCQAILCGAQAGMIAWGQTWKKYHEDFDYGRKPGTATDAIYGVSKTRFNRDTDNTAQQDYSVISVYTCANYLG